MVEGWIAAGKLSEQQIADWRERGIMPPWHATTACGMPLKGIGVSSRPAPAETAV